MNNLHEGDKFAGNDNNRRVVHSRLAATNEDEFDHAAAWEALGGHPDTCPKPKKAAAVSTPEPEDDDEQESTEDGDTGSQGASQAGTEGETKPMTKAEQKAAAKAAKAAAKLSPPKPTSAPSWSANA